METYIYRSKSSENVRMLRVRERRKGKKLIECKNVEDLVLKLYAEQGLTTFFTRVPINRKRELMYPLVKC